jgi:hypothetical protein|tara:strand:- start:528 stop:1316 length:789 start_codon:yes stop_codon:yes gene_type:complete
MALWYNSSSSSPNSWRAADFQRDTLSSDVFFCCPGPSLSLVDASKLNGPGRVVVAVNNAYPYIRPDIWFGMDDPNCYSRQIFWEPFIKILRGGYQSRTCEGQRVDLNYNVFYADTQKYQNGNVIFTRGQNIPFQWKRNVMATALHVLIWMGMRRVFFIGCDLDNSKSDYHHDQELSEKNKNWNRRLYKDLNVFMSWFAKAGLERGVESFSCSKTSKLNDYMDCIDVEDAIRASEKGIPFGGELTHTLDIDGTEEENERASAQ